MAVAAASPDAAGAPAHPAVAAVGLRDEAGRVLGVRTSRPSRFRLIGAKVMLRGVSSARRGRGDTCRTVAPSPVGGVVGHSRIVVAVAFGVLLLLGPAGTAHAAEKPDGTATVSGTVTDPATGAPVGNAPVTLKPTSTTYVPAKDGVGNDACEEIYPNPTATGTTDGTGRFTMQVKAYRGSDRCSFLIIGRATLPSGDDVRGAQVVQGLLPGATVPLNLPGAGAQANVRQPVPAVSAETTPANASNAPESGFPGWLDASGPWLLRLGLVLVVAAVTALFLWLCVLVGRAARRKGRSYWAWFWIALFFLVPAAIIVAIMAPAPEYRAGTGPPAPRPPTPEPVKRCPFCGEEILAVARKCKHCGEFLQAD